ncbi:hypothetical protein L3Q82_021946 [Scortum barcoo]|uniref:Uncharacterized protein n=1 Tax=Scortum barcoo TaxID=214431 RepID=A0ACB8X3F1_9TELE|nr:hypothetical protein L3Q82_021946 [Scortum barcoo]
MHKSKDFFKNFAAKQSIGGNGHDKQPAHSNIKRPKRAEVNFLPNFPRSENLGSLERIRLQIVDEVKMTNKNLTQIAALMQTTFALWRKEVISDELPVGEILDCWPALAMKSQICSEFQRITNVNLKNHFCAEVDRHAPRLQSLFRKKAACTGKIAEALDQLFSAYDLQPVKSPEVDVDDVPVGIALITANSTDATFLVPDRVTVIIEGNLVIDLPTLADGYIILFGLIYPLHLHYPKELASTFDFIQKKPRVLSLKKDLLAVE